MDIPPSVTDALVDAAVAAQEARGAGGDRAARGGGGDDESDFSYAPEKENQNLLNLLYLIAEVDPASRPLHMTQLTDAPLRINPSVTPTSTAA